MKYLKYMFKYFPGLTVPRYLNCVIFIFLCCLLYKTSKLIIEDTCVHCGEGNGFGIVKFIRKLSGCCFFNLHLQLKNEDCKELTLV